MPALFREGAQIYHQNYFSAAARQLYGPVAVDSLPVERGSWDTAP